MSDPRYASGTSLDRTTKERYLDSFENMVGGIDDDLYAGLKRLTIAQIKELHKVVTDKVDNIYIELRG